jgi:hypothetical protein
MNLMETNFKKPKFYSYFWRSIYTKINRVDQILSSVDKKEPGMVMSTVLTKKLEKIDSKSNLRSKAHIYNNINMINKDNKNKNSIIKHYNLFEEFAQPNNLRNA